MSGAFFIYPVVNGARVPPKTAGAVVGQSGADFLKGDLQGTECAGTGGALNGTPAGKLALSLRPAASGGSFTSTPLTASFPFNALDLHWTAAVPEGASLSAEVRFSDDGANWEDWQPVRVDEDEAPDFALRSGNGETYGELVFTNKARYFQYRLDLKANSTGQSPDIYRVTGSYIDAKGYHESIISPGRIIDGMEAMVEPPPAGADPAVISRAQWGADESLMTWMPEYTPPKKIIIHHTDTPNNDPDPAATVRSIYYDQAVIRGWGDIGYNYLVDSEGHIYDGRKGGDGVIGGHAYGWNAGSIGIAAMGDFDSGDITPAMSSALVTLMSAKSNLYHINPQGNDYFVHYVNGAAVGGNPPNYLGHRDALATVCPGQYLYARLPSLRTAAARDYETFPVYGAIRWKWETVLNKAPGDPLNAEYDVPGGRAQNFTSGAIFWNSTTGGTYWIKGGIKQKYDSLGGIGGFLGWPVSDEYQVAWGSEQDFTGGRIYWSAATGAGSVNGGILARYLESGGPSSFGFPLGDEHDVPGYSGSRESDFQFSRIYWDATRGTIRLYGGILAEFLGYGGTVAFGPPLVEEHDIPGVPSGRQSDFANARIYWLPAIGARSVYGAIYAKYASLGGPAGFLGMR